MAMNEENITQETQDTQTNAKNTQDTINKQAKSEETIQHEHIYIDMLREKYKRNLELCEVAEMVMKIKAESDAQLFALQQLLVDKELATPEEMRSAMNPKHIAQLVEIIENGYDAITLNGMRENGKTKETSAS